MIAYYGNRISPNMTDTPEGYLICHDVPIARIGPMEYRRGEVQLDGDPVQTVKINRYPEDVFEAAAIASFEGKDITAGHPPDNVGPENYAAYSKGHVENVRRSGDYLIADLLVKDPGLMNDIRNGVIREVSCGYLCVYEPDGSDYKQTHIRGNHVAVVPRGRAGHEVAIKDAASEMAEKGRKSMNKFTRSILSVFGAAARDAAPEEMDKMVDTAAAALEAVPADKAPEAAPAEDVMVERAPKGDDLGSKLDRILSMMEELQKKNDREERMDRKLTGEDDLDDLIENLSGGEHLDKEKSVTIPADKLDDACMDDATRDALLGVLKKVRPVVASIEDRAERARVTDALISAIKGPNLMGSILEANQKAAKKAADSMKKSSYEDICKAQKDAYDSRNPHKQKEVK